ncbi:hypothetical protein AB0A05_26880 [Streptomyces sp. NPDC046374]|uniref:hypothetical protein n=1 Tax=Streptomyces sp. NPDC046374 TaxID=3154917 RepID=UPI0034054187
MEALERLAALPERERPANAGPLWVSNRGCLAIARLKDQDVVGAGLQLLGQLEYPFWFAPTLWALIESGWSQDRLHTLLAAGLDDARNVWAVVEKRLSAAVPDVPGGLPVDDPARPATPPVGAQIDAAAQSWGKEVDPGPEYAPWDRPKSVWWDKSNPGAPAYELTRHEMDAIDPGEASQSNDHMAAAVASIRAALPPMTEAGKRKKAEAQRRS